MQTYVYTWKVDIKSFIALMSGLIVDHEKRSYTIRQIGLLLVLFIVTAQTSVLACAASVSNIVRYRAYEKKRSVRKMLLAHRY